ncbi:cupin domain-containing protein [Acrocarpospora catenulata]|uniref:cupin domain-containing protein n=1 Tax=Acrocarpospora catenulata TaxID=2836182 RepID=UPI001BD9AF35|nr:cupin [Acrocarpospora catenulata]
MHTLCAETYVVIGGSGSVQTLTWSGFQETPLEPGVVVWFTPGTVHRLINGGDLRIIVLMQNSGLPEAGDAVFTFPPSVLDDPVRYAEAASGDVRARRDLAISGFITLKEGGFDDFLTRATRIITPRLDTFEHRWREGPLKSALTTGAHLTALRSGDPTHLREAAVTRLTPEPKPGMCGNLQAYPSR